MVASRQRDVSAGTAASMPGPVRAAAADAPEPAPGDRSRATRTPTEPADRAALDRPGTSRARTGSDPVRRRATRPGRRRARSSDRPPRRGPGEPGRRSAGRVSGPSPGRPTGRSDQHRGPAAVQSGPSPRAESADAPRPTRVPRAAIRTRSRRLPRQPPAVMSDGHALQPRASPTDRQSAAAAGGQRPQRQPHRPARTDLSSARLLRPAKRPPQSGWRAAVYVAVRAADQPRGEPGRRRAAAS